MIEAMKQVKAFLEHLTTHSWTLADQQKAIELQSQAIAELESQEPVATVTSETGADITMSWWHEPALPIGTKLYTHPPQRTWIDLTQQEIDEIDEQSPSLHDFVQNLMSKLKERNT